MTIRAVIFDLGHTLWDIKRQPDALERAYASLRATLTARLGRDDLPEARAMMESVGAELRTYGDVLVREPELGLNQDFAQPPSHTWVDAGLRTLGLELEPDVLVDVTPPLFATEIDGLICSGGTRKAVADLAARGFRLGCVTNTLAYTATIHEMLRRHGFAEWMQTVVVSSQEGIRKPHPLLFEKAARALGVERNQALFVGDSPFHDIRGAKHAGMLAVLTRQYVARPHDGLEPPPDAIIEHVRELPDVIRRLDAR